MSLRCTRQLAALVIVFSGVACASRVLQYEKADEVLKTEEYDQKVQVKPVEPPPAPKVEEIKAPAAGKATPKKTSKAKKKDAAKVEKKGPRQPEMEDSVGFSGRRPLKDPFRVGEKVEYSLSYFNIVAGSLAMTVMPMVEVNGQKAYHFSLHAQSNSFFNRIYGVDDTAETYLSYDEMVPLNLSITLKESKQLAEARTFVDWKTLKASYWQKRVTKEKGEQSKKIDWQVLPYSQNVISAVYYMRVFSYEPGKQYAFRVADEGKNIVFSAEVLRKEKLKTDVGEFNTIVLKPKITVDGNFAPVGDILFWMTDDDRKLIVRIEAKIKLGTLVAKLRSLDKGQDSLP
jgi:hypothetical protein